MDRDRQNLALLRQAVDYGLVLSELAREEIYGGSDFSPVCRHVVWGKFFDRHHKKLGDALPGGISYITPTAAGLAFIGSAKDRVNNSNAAISQCLPVYWFCKAAERRYLVTQEMAEKILGPVPNNVPFVAANERNENVIYRVYIATSDVSKTLQHVKELLDGAPAGLKIAVLAETPDKVESIRELLTRKKTEALVSLGPSPDTIADCLRARRRGK
jgi:hypothetical protein